MDSMFNTLLARALAGGSGGGGGGTGTDDYTDLNNKPKVNNVTVVGNLTSSDLKLQGEITNSHKLSADLVDDSTSTNKFNVQADWDQTTNSAPDYIKNKPTLGTAAATDATAYATAAQGTKADSAIQTVEVNGTALTPTSAKAVNITVPTQASDINALPNTTKYAAALSLTIDSSTFVVTGQLKDQNGDNLGTAQTIDLPLESVVVGGSYDSQTKKVILTLQNGNTVEFSIADLVSGLQTELSATNKLDPSFINYDTTHAAVTESDKTTWSGKQDALTFDGTYSASTNKAATVSTVTNAVNALDVTGDASVSASKTISAWSETDGKVSISTQDIAIAGTQTTLTGYAKSGTAGQAVAATDSVNQAIGKLEATIDDNKNNISLLRTFMAYVGYSEVIKVEKQVDNPNRIKFYIQGYYNGDTSTIKTGSLFARSIPLNTDLTVDNAEVDQNLPGLTMNGIINDSRGDGLGVLVKPYIEISGERHYGVQQRYFYSDLT